MDFGNTASAFWLALGPPNQHGYRNTVAIRADVVTRQELQGMFPKALVRLVPLDAADGVHMIQVIGQQDLALEKNE